MIVDLDRGGMVFHVTSFNDRMDGLCWHEDDFGVYLLRPEHKGVGRAIFNSDFSWQ